MDNQKDSRTEPEKSNSPALSHKTTEPISYFDHNSVFVFVFKKTEKLATALYMVTNLFSESEPMKWALRKKTSELLSFIVTYKDTPLSGFKTFTEDVKSRVLEIVSLLEVASRSGLVSSMNFSILKKEFMNLVSVLETSEPNHSEDNISSLSKSFFDVAKPQFTAPQISKPSEVVREEITPAETPPSPIKDNEVSPTPPVFKRNNRQNIILQLLKKKSDLTVKDIAQTIRDCSEKTIQRELISLIEAGLIGKKGERRWTKYFLQKSE